VPGNRCRDRRTGSLTIGVFNRPTFVRPERLEVRRLIDGDSGSIPVDVEPAAIIIHARPGWRGIRDGVAVAVDRSDTYRVIGWTVAGPDGLSCSRFEYIHPGEG